MANWFKEEIEHFGERLENAVKSRCKIWIMLDFVVSEDRTGINPGAGSALRAAARLEREKSRRSYLHRCATAAPRPIGNSGAEPTVRH